jgi:hypothetical protein
MPVVIVREFGFSVDCRKLNDETRNNCLLLTGLEEAWATFAEAKSFSSLDLHSGYWQVAQRSEGRKHDFHQRARLWKFTVMPFGILQRDVRTANADRLMRPHIWVIPRAPGWRDLVWRPVLWAPTQPTNVFQRFGEALMKLSVNSFRSEYGIWVMLCH